MTKLKATLPKGDANGLEPQRRLLLAEPNEARVLVGIVEVVGYTVDYEQGTKIPAVKLEAVELVLDEVDASTVMDIIARARTARSHGLVTMDGTEPPPPSPGSGELPIDLGAARKARQ